MAMKDGPNFEALSLSAAGLLQDSGNFGNMPD